MSPKLRSAACMSYTMHQTVCAIQSSLVKLFSCPSPLLLRVRTNCKVDGLAQSQALRFGKALTWRGVQTMAGRNPLIRQERRPLPCQRRVQAQQRDAL